MSHGFLFKYWLSKDGAISSWMTLAYNFLYGYIDPPRWWKEMHVDYNYLLHLAVHKSREYCMVILCHK
jgi:hypothetical protein